MQKSYINCNLSVKFECYAFPRNSNLNGLNALHLALEDNRNDSKLLTLILILAMKSSKVIFSLGGWYFPV